MTGKAQALLFRGSACFLEKPTDSVRAKEICLRHLLRGTRLGSTLLPPFVILSQTIVSWCWQHDRSNLEERTQRHTNVGVVRAAQGSGV